VVRPARARGHAARGGRHFGKWRLPRRARPGPAAQAVEQGADPVGNSPEEFERQLRDEVARWIEVVKVSGAKAD